MTVTPTTLKIGAVGVLTISELKPSDGWGNTVVVDRWTGHAWSRVGILTSRLGSKTGPVRMLKSGAFISGDGEVGDHGYQAVEIKSGKPGWYRFMKRYVRSDDPSSKIRLAAIVVRVD